MLNRGIPEYVSDEHIHECWKTYKSDPMIRRCVHIINIYMFERPQTEYGQTTVQDPLQTSQTSGFSITWGIKRKELNSEFKSHIHDFMVNALDALYAWGFVPWYKRQVQSSHNPEVKFWIPCVAKEGCFRIRQARDGNFGMTYEIEPSAGETGSGVYDPRTPMNSPAIAKESERVLRSRTIHRPSYIVSGASANPPAKRVLQPSGSNKRSHTMGVAMIEGCEPDSDGTLTSQTAVVRATVEHVETMKMDELKAVRKASDPVLMTQSSASSHDSMGIRAGSSLTQMNDMSARRTINEMQRDELMRERMKQAKQRTEMEASKQGTESHVLIMTDGLTREKQMVDVDPFFRQRERHIPEGRQVVHQQMPQSPSNVTKWQQSREDITCSVFNVPRPLAMGYSSSSLRAGSEINYSMVKKSSEMHAAILARLTSDILNRMHRESETEELIDRLYIMGHTLSEDEREEMIATLNSPVRYHVEFHPLSEANIEDIIAVANRGVFDRKTEANLLVRQLGLNASAAKLQAFPNPYEKIEEGKTQKPKTSNPHSSAHP